MSETLWVKCGLSFTVFVNLPTATVNTLCHNPVSREIRSHWSGCESHTAWISESGGNDDEVKHDITEEEPFIKVQQFHKGKGGGQSEGKHGNILELQQVITTGLMFISRNRDMVVEQKGSWKCTKGSTAGKNAGTR